MSKAIRLCDMRLTENRLLSTLVPCFALGVVRIVQGRSKNVHAVFAPTLNISFYIGSINPDMRSGDNLATTKAVFYWG